MPTLEEVKKRGKKEFYWSFSQKIRHELAFPISTLLLKTSATPNMVTTSWILLQFLSGFLLATGDYVLMVVGILIYGFTWILDCVDGQMARFKNSSFKGFYLEMLGGFSSSFLTFVGLGIGVYRITLNPIYLLIGISIGVIHLLTELIGFNGYWEWANPKKFPQEAINKLNHTVDYFRVKNVEKIHPIANITLELFRRGNPLNFLFWALLFKIPHIALFIYFILFSGKFTMKLYKQIQSLEKLDRETFK